jgi:AP-1 complex subunit sigma 1/2
MFISADFPFLQAYYILDEILIAGELQESSKKNVARLIAAQVCTLKKRYLS